MPALEPEVTHALALRAIGGALLRLKWLAAATRFEIALRRHDRALKYAYKYGYNPEQPRDEIGRWTDTGGGQGVRLAAGVRMGGGRRGGFGSGSFSGLDYGREFNLYVALARLQNVLAQVRQYEPDWEPSIQSVTSPFGIEGAIRRAEARTSEAEARLDQLRRGIGGNFGPSLNPSGSASESSGTGRPSNIIAGQSFNAPDWISAYRAVNNRPDLLGRPIWPPDDDTVAVTEINGKVYFGINSTAPGYTNADEKDANSWRWTLINRYPDDLLKKNIGSWPNDAFYHAESTVLYRIARENGGTLEGLTFEVYTDKDMCATSCPIVLPKLGLGLGNPRVTFIGPYGLRHTMSNGNWE